MRPGPDARRVPDLDAAMSVLGEPGWRLLLAAGVAFEASGGDALAASTALLRECPGAPPAQRAVALELVFEGARLATKIGAFERLLAVRGAVEQASSGRVATWHAQRIPSGARLLEIGCGCGGDSLALAHRARNLIAVDADPVRAACAHMNLAALGLSNARAVPGDGFDVLATEAADADVIFADPDRRPGGVRSLDPEAWRPSLSSLAALATPERRVFVKAAPSLDADFTPGVFDVAYVSSGGECVEAFLESRADTSGAQTVREQTVREQTVREQTVRAVLLPPDGPSVTLDGDRSDASAGALGEALYVPDPAAIRARLLAELCHRHGLALVDPGVAWLTGPAGAHSPWMRAYQVVAHCGLQDVPKTLRGLGARAVRVHVRGVPVAAPEVESRWRRALDKRGSGGTVDVFVSRFLGQPGAVLARD